MKEQNLFDFFSNNLKIIKNCFKKTLIFFLDNGPITFSKKVLSKTLKLIFKAEYSYNRWIIKNEPRARELKSQKKMKFSLMPKISLITPVYNSAHIFLKQMLDSVISQTYSNWELCVADGSSDILVRDILVEYMKKDNRLKYKYLNQNMGIAGNSNEAISLSTGDYLAMLDHDDILPKFALFEIVKAVNENPTADLLYSDHDIINNDSIRNEYIFKPDYSPDTLRSHNYINHLAVYKRDLLDEVGIFRDGFEGSQDYDLVLRASEKAKKIIHIPKVLYHWRLHKHSFSFYQKNNNLAECVKSSKMALQQHLQRLGMNGIIEDGELPLTYRIKYDHGLNPLVSIIIPNKDNPDLISDCIDSIVKLSTYKNYEIVIVDNLSSEKAVFDSYEKLKLTANAKVLEWAKGFNYSAVNNYAVSNSAGEVLLFLNADTRVISPDWIERMLEYALRDDVGCVGAKLLYPEGTIQHAGVILGLGLNGIAGHFYSKFPADNIGYLGRLKCVQNVSAVTGACMMMRRRVFESLGGFDENFPLDFNDIDLCMKIRKAGYLIVWTPYAKLYHQESAFRGKPDNAEKYKKFIAHSEIFRKKWNDELLKGDPYYNPNLSLKYGDFSLRI